MTREEILFYRILTGYRVAIGYDFAAESEKQIELKIKTWIRDHKEYWNFVDSCMLYAINQTDKRAAKLRLLPYKIIDLIFEDIDKHSK
jgi:hypothetical protein